jgi:hypothetical protein
MIDYDKIALISSLPSFRNANSGSFTVSIAGNVGVGATVTWSGSVAFTASSRMVRYSMQQDVVPAVAAYTSSDRVPIAQMVGGSNFTPYVACSVAGVPAVTEIAPNVYITSTLTGANAIVSITNPYAGVMTTTATVMTIYYTAFEAFGES